MVESARSPEGSERAAQIGRSGGHEAARRSSQQAARKSGGHEFGGIGRGSPGRGGQQARARPFESPGQQARTRRLSRRVVPIGRGWPGPGRLRAARQEEVRRDREEVARTRGPDRQEVGRGDRQGEARSRILTGKETAWRSTGKEIVRRGRKEVPQDSK